MNFTSQVCTSRSQSERLLALGLKKETADMTYLNDKICAASYNEMECPYDNLVKPSWSFHRLIEMMPSNLSDNSEIDFSKFGVFYAIFHNGEYCLTHAFAKKEKVLYDNIIDCIEWLIKEGYFNKEYLEE